MAWNSESSSSSEDSNVLMKDPLVDYINQVLMEEGMEDVDGSDSMSYQAIFSSLQDIIADAAVSDAQNSLIDPRCQSLQQVDGASDYQAIFGSLQNIIADLTVSSNSNKEADEVPFIKVNDELLTDATASCPSKEVSVQGNEGQEQGSKGLKADIIELEPSSELAGLDLSFSDLKVDDVYTVLYVKDHRSLPIAAGHRRRHSQKSMAGKGKLCERDTSEVQLVFVDVREVLISCAQAVAIGDASRASEMLQELYQVYGASARGTGPQRIAYIFSRALAARLRGTGVQEFKAMSLEMPSSAEVLRASKLAFKVIPYNELMHYFANESILKAAEGASRLHILDYGLMYGMQWPCLINALADRKGGPPLLVITGIDFPLPGTDVAKRLDESGRRLAAYAKTYKVPFQYHAIVTDKWEDLDAASLLLHSEGEVLVVNCVKRVRHLSDDSIDLDSPNSARQKLLTCWHSLNPHLLVTGVMTAAQNSPFFVSRFRETLDFYYNVFDMLDTVWGDIPERLIMERSFYYRNIMNLVACEGAERVERAETYKQWHAHITEAGFEQLPIPSTIMARSKGHVKQHYHKDFQMDDDEKGWMLMCWKGRAILAISAWKPCCVPSRCEGHVIL